MSPEEQDWVVEKVRLYTEAFHEFDFGTMLFIMLNATDAERRILLELRRDLIERKL